MGDAILTLNAGSSSLKFALFAQAGDGLERHAAGAVEGIGASPHLILRDSSGGTVAERRWPDGERHTHEDFLRELFPLLDRQLGSDRLAGVGHRVVHGGERFTDPVLVNDDVLDQLEKMVPLAPLHEPHNIAPIRAVAASRPGLPQIACFDTAFHKTLPPVAYTFALPRELSASGIRRYGFHGLSYEYLAGALRERAPALAAGRVVLAHLGNGASLCALHEGRSVETTMGFTALDGLVMGTRSGAIDPGVILYLMQNRGMAADDVVALLYKKSGLLGVSGVGSDMRALLASREPEAALAVALFCYRAASEAAALGVALGGLDGIVFAAGIGEHSPEVRQGICARLEWLGVRLDAERNAAGKGRISAEASKVAVWVIPTDEEAVIARHAAQLLGRA